MARRARPLIPPEELDVERALSFVNTRSGRATPNPTEKLVSFEALVNWSHEAGLLKASDAEQLAARARRRLDEAARLLARACELRELLHEAFSATSKGNAPRAATLDALSEQLGGWYRHGRLAPSDDSLQWISTTSPKTSVSVKSFTCRLPRSAPCVIDGPPGGASNPTSAAAVCAKSSIATRLETAPSLRKR